MKILLLCIVLTAGASLAQTLIAYGDTRFTDPKEENATNPKVRRWLVNRIAEEKPNAILVSGDLPWNGGVANDYAIYHDETAVWRKAHLLISPALGNHEFHGTEKQCLENWWHEFPDLRGRRWHSVAVGPRIMVLNLDSTSSLLPDSPQIAWIQAQLESAVIGRSSRGDTRKPRVRDSLRAEMVAADSRKPSAPRPNCRPDFRNN